jgi:hypothetical protein
MFISPPRSAPQSAFLLLGDVFTQIMVLRPGRHSPFRLWRCDKRQVIPFRVNRVSSKDYIHCITVQHRSATASIAAARECRKKYLHDNHFATSLRFDSVQFSFFPVVQCTLPLSITCLCLLCAHSTRVSNIAKILNEILLIWFILALVIASVPVQQQQQLF